MPHGGILTNLGGECIAADFWKRRISHAITLNDQISFLTDFSSFKLKVGRSFFWHIEPRYSKSGRKVKPSRFWGCIFKKTYEHIGYYLDTWPADPNSFCWISCETSQFLAIFHDHMALISTNKPEDELCQEPAVFGPLWAYSQRQTPRCAGIHLSGGRFFLG